MCIYIHVCVCKKIIGSLSDYFTHLNIKNPSRNWKVRNNSDQFGSVSSKHRAAKISKNPGGELKACKFPLLPPLFTINRKYSITKQISNDVLVILTFGILIEVGLQNMLDVSCVSRADKALFRCKEPESRILGGNCSMVVVEFVEIEELVENSAFYRWVCWVVDGLARVESKYEKREK